MNISTQKIKTPKAQTEIEIKDWITGGEAEHIDQAILEAVDVKGGQSGANIGKIDLAAVKEQTHREITAFVVSIDGKKENILKTVMALPEEDYEFLKKEISARRKKKVNQTEL